MRATRYAATQRISRAAPPVLVAVELHMVSITIASVLGLASLAAVVRLRRRRVGVNGLDNVSVSRQWLVQHQSDER